MPNNADVSIRVFVFPELNDTFSDYNDTVGQIVHYIMKNEGMYSRVCLFFYVRAPVISGWRCEPVTLGKWPLFVLLPWNDHSWHYCLVHCHTLLGKEVSRGFWAVCVFSDESGSEMKLLVEVHIQDNGRRIWGDHLLWRRCCYAFEYKSHECFICDFIPFLPFAGSKIHDKSLQKLCSMIS